VCSSWITGKTESQGLTSVLTKRSVGDSLMIVGCFDTYVQRLPATSTLVHQHDAYVVSSLTLITPMFNMRNVTVSDGNINTILDG
jgi:hypothetical protein